MSSNPQAPAPVLTLKLALDDVNLVLEALGQMPYLRVHDLIARIQEQGRAQVQDATAGPSNGDARSGDTSF